jgi:hypothetical protein
MRAAARRFSPGNRYGVVAYGIRGRRRRGRRDGTLGLVVYVVRKRERPRSPVPSFHVQVAGRALRIVPDVVGTGEMPRLAATEDAPFTGLHAGAAIKVGDDSPELGAVGCLLTGGGGQPTHLVTAGHLFEGAGADGDPTYAAASDDDDVICVGNLVANLLDEGDRRRVGLDRCVDVALVKLTDDGAQLATATRAPCSIGGVLSSGAANGRSGQIFSWIAGDFSPEGAISSLPTVVHFGESARGAFSVSDVLTLEPRVTDAGNSGTALLSADADRQAIGVCVGAYRIDSVFEPLDRALAALRSKFGPLDIWNNPHSRGKT